MSQSSTEDLENLIISTTLIFKIYILVFKGVVFLLFVIVFLPKGSWQSAISVMWKQSKIQEKKTINLIGIFFQQKYEKWSNSDSLPRWGGELVAVYQILVRNPQLWFSWKENICYTIFILLTYSMLSHTKTKPSFGILEK